MSMNHNSLLEKSDSKDKMTLRHFEYSSKDGVASMADIPYYAFPKLEKISYVKHAFSTREGGVSEGIFRSMNFGFLRGDKPESVRENYHRYACLFGVSENRIVLSHQTHTTNVRVVTEEDAGKGLTRERDYTDVDGLITNVPKLVLGIFAADCVPLLFIDPVHHAIGASHSGWRGTVSRMGAVTLQKMKETYGTDPKDVIAAIGPSICKKCYEVSEDVAERFIKEFYKDSSEIVHDDGINAAGEHKYHLDLWEANRRVLLDAGVRPENISVTDLCTNCHPDIFFSHRFTKGQRGNNGAFIMLTE